MGRLIDADEVKKRFPIMENDFGMVINERLHKHLDEIPTVEAIPKADIITALDNGDFHIRETVLAEYREEYEARLKADLVAILEELDLTIREQIIDEPAPDGTNEGMACYNGGLLKGSDLIQKEINALKENTDE